MSVYPHDQFGDIPNRPGIQGRTLAGPEHGITTFFIQEDRLETGARIPLHTHPVDEVLVVVEGRLTVTAGAETQTVPSDTTLVIPPGTPHRLVNDGPDSVRILAAAAWNRATFYQQASTYLEGQPRG